MNVRHIGYAIAVALIAAAPAAAQWLKHPTAGIPRHADGTPNLSAPAPKRADGKPDISGLWRPAIVLVGDIAANLPPGSVPFQPWAEKLYKERRANNSRDDPTASCIVGGVPRSDLVPYPFKILQLPEMVVILYEAVHSYRQIFTDGRALPKQGEPQPWWYGYSVGRWEGDTLVVESNNFRDDQWLDIIGSPMTDAARVVERFRRVNFGRMEIDITIEDSKAYTRPWTVRHNQSLILDEDLIEFVCLENQRFGKPEPN